MTGLRIVVGCDDAGYDYKEALKGDLLADDRVADVTDVGRRHRRAHRLSARRGGGCPTGGRGQGRPRHSASAEKVDAICGYE